MFESLLLTYLAYHGYFAPWRGAVFNVLRCFSGLAAVGVYFSPCSTFFCVYRSASLDLVAEKN